MKNKKEDYHDLAATIIHLVGGEENITNVIHCVTKYMMDSVSNLSKFYPFPTPYIAKICNRLRLMQ